MAIPSIVSPAPATPAANVTAVEERLKATVIGQPEALEELTKCYRRFKAGLGPVGRPQGIYLLIGPTGSGKSYLATQFARAITGTDWAPLRIDCAEYREGHEVAKLIGSPPGYLGHRETPPLLSSLALGQQRSNDQPLAFLLLDEVDKAHPKFWDLFLGVFDNGRLILGDNSKVDFTNTVILLTGNIGARALASQHEAFGLATALPKEASVPTKGKQAAELAARRMLRPEMFNRIDRVLVFNTLDQPSLRTILDLELIAVVDRLWGNKGISLSVTTPAKDLILNDGLDPKFGARHLKRSIQRNLETGLADYIIANPDISSIQACVRDGQITFTEVAG